MWQISCIIICVHLFQVSATVSQTGNFQTDKGPIFGLEDSVTGVKYFYGVPYAKPPTGNLRFKDPEMPDTWTNPLDCTQVKDQCPQNNCLDELGCFNTIGNEDCLYINLYVPPTTTSNPSKPVAVFLHGGAFELGTGGSPLYNGTNMALLGDIIVVTADFRIGVLGSLVFDDGTEATNGNYFIKDQRLVFEWVQNNIDNFGGDPNKVTCFGQSSGAQACAIHSYTANSLGLFQRAFYMSLPASMFTRTTTQMQRRGNAIATNLNCATVACLRGKPADAFRSAGSNANTGSNDFISFFQPNTVHQDGTDVTKTYIDAANNGLFDPNMDYMISFTTDETIRETYGAIPGELSDFEYRILLRYWRKCEQCNDMDSLIDVINNFQNKCTLPNPFLFFLQVISNTNCPNGNLADIYVRYFCFCNDLKPKAADVTGDFIYKCPIRNIGKSLASNAATGKKVWVAQFDQHAPAIANDICVSSACHAQDLIYYFKTFDRYLHIFNDTTQADYDLADAMICYFTNFVRWGNPNDKTDSSDHCQQNVDLVQWKRFKTDKIRQIVFKENDIFLDKNKLFSGSTFQFSKCSFWDDTAGYAPKRN